MNAVPQGNDENSPQPRLFPSRSEFADALKPLRQSLQIALSPRRSASATA